VKLFGTPFLGKTDQRYILKWDLITQWFPNLRNAYVIRDIKVQKNISKTIDFAPHCCIYEDVNKLSVYNDPIIFLRFSYFQSHKYFPDPDTPGFRDWLKFNDSLTMTSKQITTSFMRPVKPRLCAHVRRTSFLTHPTLESQKNFIRAAVRYIINMERVSFAANYSANNALFPVYIFSDDKTWSSQLFNDSDHIEAVIVNSAAELPVMDWVIATNNCDIILLTASASTFGWWMAFLSPSSTKIFYNWEFAKPENTSANVKNFRRDFNRDTFFPPKWTALKYDAIMDTIRI